MERKTYTTDAVTNNSSTRQALTSEQVQAYLSFVKAAPHYSVYSMRCTFCSNMVKSGMNPRLSQATLAAKIQIEGVIAEQDVISQIESGL